MGTQTFTVLAEELDNTARAERWPKLADLFPQADQFARCGFATRCLKGERWPGLTRTAACPER